MFTISSSTRFAAFSFMLLMAGANTALAQVFFSQERRFIIDQPCDAYASFKKKTQPQTLEVGAAYTALGENKNPGGTHAYLALEGQRKWVALNCGHYQDDGGVGFGGDEGNDANTAACLPFFDDEDNPVRVNVGGLVDITPPAPRLEPFGQAVNATCGAAGKVVSREEFQALMRAHPDVLERLMAFTGGRVYANRPKPDSSDTYLQDLTDAWFNVHAFDHIMCGEPGDKGKIGGLHFHGRYLQLQQSGEACRMANYRQNEVMPGVIYTMGVAMKGADGRFYRHATKGYGLTLSAEDILQAVTRAFADNPTRSNSSSACLLSLQDDGHRFTSVFVRRAAGIRTFYPDATPSSNAPECKPPIDLAHS